MCLGIPGQIVAVTDPTRMMAMADVSGVRREVSLAPVAVGPPPGPCSPPPRTWASTRAAGRPSSPSLGMCP